MSEKQIQYVCCDLCPAKAVIGTEAAKKYAAFAAQGNRSRFDLCPDCNLKDYQDTMYRAVQEIWAAAKLSDEKEGAGLHNGLVVDAIHSMCLCALQEVAGEANTV